LLLAAGRLVHVKVAAEGTVQGRVTGADADGVTLDVAGAKRRFTYAQLGPGAIQVEFGRIPDDEVDELDELGDDDHPDDEVSDDALLGEADLGAGGDGH
jgi:ribosome maturation factor RimP